MLHPRIVILVPTRTTNYQARRRSRSSEFRSRRLTGAKQMQRKAAKLQAQRLIEEFGPAAYEQTQAAERVARRKQDKRLANFLAEVMRQIAGQERP